MTDEQVAAVIKTTLESSPKNAIHWSTRSMAEQMGLSQSSVSRIWRAFGLRPHRSETFKLSTDPYFVDKVHDVVGLYLDPVGAENSAKGSELGVRRFAEEPCSGRQDRVLWVFDCCI